jgi:P27 family predicted phage terminase small subunit
MELDATADAMLLEALCTNYETAVRAHLKIRTQGEVIEDPIVSRDTGKIIGYRARKNPWLPIREHAHRLLLSFCSEFGVSPAARTRLNVTAPVHDDADVQAVLSTVRD